MNRPIFPQFFRGKYQYAIIPYFVIFNDSKGLIRFTEANTIGNNTAVVLLNFTDAAYHPIFLKLIKFVPNESVFDSCSAFNDIFFINKIKRILKQVIQRLKIE